MAKAKLGDLTMADLEREIHRRQKVVGRYVRKLERRRDKVVGQLAAIDAEIAKFDGASRRGRRPGGRRAGGGRAGGGRRPRNEMNLADALATALKSATMSVTEVAEAVQKAGYKTTSPNFRTIVNQTLVKDARFKRVGRGQYTIK